MRSALGRGLITATCISATLGAVFEVSVGLDGPPGRCAGIASFNPRSIQAAAGDEVNFILHSYNVSLTQTEFDSPCELKKSGSPQSVSFLATGEREGTARLVLGPDYDGSPLRFLYGGEDSCLPETVFTVNGPIPNEVPSRSDSLPPCSNPPPQLNPQSTIAGPIIVTFTADRDVTNTASFSTNVPPIPVFTSNTVKPQDGAAPGSVAPLPTTTSDELGPTSTFTIAVLPHTTLVTERVFPRRSSTSVGESTGLSLEPSASIVLGSIDLSESSDAQSIVAVSHLPLLLALYLWTI